jgi:arylsulfatase A-like enzyme
VAGAEVPDDRAIDGYDLRPALFGAGSSPREEMFFYRADELYAVRKGPFKAHFITQGVYGRGPGKERHDPSQLYQLGHDPSEQFNVASDHPGVIESIKELVEQHRASIRDVEDQLSKRQ